MAKRRISRRQFMGTAVVGAAAGARGFKAPGKGLTPRPQENASASPGPRLVRSLNAGWRFKRQVAAGPEPEPELSGAERLDYDDSSWAQVYLPHTWDATPLNPFGTPGHFRGLGWYRRRLEIPREWQGRRVHIEFKGACQVADVWVNGHLAGRHVGGFTGFTFDVSDLIEPGSNNLLAVRVDDTLDPNIAPANETNVPVYGGIYRSVSLVVTDIVHFPAHALQVVIEGSENGPANIRVVTRIENPGPTAASRKLETSIVDPSGRAVAVLDEDVTAPSKQFSEVRQTAPPISNPDLWSPDSPHLYRVVSTLYDGNRALDQVVTPFGIRFMGYDLEKGFTINGKPIQLHGVNRRQDYGFLGDAVPEAVAVKDIRLIKEMGANFIRTSHYPQDPAVLDACDQLGILVWEEIPNIKLYTYPTTTEDSEPGYLVRFSRPFVENLKHQLREMIERDCNHPSIIIWGLADDLSNYDYPEDFTELSDFAHGLDPTRWTAGRAPHVTDIIDATSEPHLVEKHRSHPDRKYIWNEWGAFPSERGREGGKASVRSHADADPEHAPMPDSEAAVLLEGYWMQWNALPWLGTGKWCMFDAGEPNKAFNRSPGEWRRGNVYLRWPFNDYMGVADMWRLPKEGFYFLQSQWTEKPMVHIVGHWTWTGAEGQNLTVRVYSNCETVELYLNGRSLGARPPANAERVWRDFQEAVGKYKYRDEFNQQPLPGASLRHPPFIWDAVTYARGALLAVGRKGGEVVRYEVRTAGPPVRIVLKADKTTLAANESDVSFVEADVVDASGVTVPDARPWVLFSVNGPGRLLGGATEIDAISGVAAINLQSTDQAGEIQVSASATGLSPGLIRILSVREA